jgi:hypothetical protein
MAIARHGGNRERAETYPWEGANDGVLTSHQMSTV